FCRHRPGCCASVFLLPFRAFLVFFVVCAVVYRRRIAAAFLAGIGTRAGGLAKPGMGRAGRLAGTTGSVAVCGAVIVAVWRYWQRFVVSVLEYRPCRPAATGFIKAWGEEESRQHCQHSATWKLVIGLAGWFVAGAFGAIVVVFAAGAGTATIRPVAVGI